MKTLLLLLAVGSGPAHAGWFNRFCQRNLISDDPYQYEQVSEDWIARRIDKLSIKEAWGTISPAETIDLRLLRREMEFRLITAGVL